MKQRNRNKLTRTAQMLLLLLLLLLLFALCGCGGQEAESQTPEDILQTAETMSEKPGFLPDDSLITELYSEEGTYEDAYGTQIEYSWHLPQIVDDSKAARELNARLAADEAQIQSDKKSMQKKEYVIPSQYSWERYWHGSRLFLKLSSESGLWNDYTIVCYDFATQKEVTPSEILAELGVTEQTWRAAAKKAALHYFDKFCTDKIKRRNYYNDGHVIMRARLLSDSYWDDEMQTDIYINDKNELRAILDIPTMAGAGHYYADLPIDLDASKGRNLTVTESFITAELRDGKLSLTFTQNEDSELVFGAIKNPPEYGKTYPVDGICDDYQQMLIGYLGNNINPYLFLLTLDGRVEVVNITSGMQYGYYCSTGPLPKTVKKTGLGMGTVSEGGGAYQTVYALNSKGKKKDLASSVFAMQNAVLLSMTGRDWHTKVTHKTEGGSYTDDYWVEFFDDHSLCIQNAFAEGGLTTTYNGSYDILGMTEDGLVLIWNAKEKGKKKTRYRGVWAVTQLPGLTVTYKAGTDFFDAGEGGQTLFEESFG